MFRTYWGLEDVLMDQGPTALAIGNFDGLHRGHIKILEQTKREARRLGGEAMVLTFHPHPTKVVAPERESELLMTLNERVRHFEKCGRDAVVVVPFTHETASLRPADFVHKVLIEKLTTRSVVVGEGFRFGHQQAGTLATLTMLGKQLDFDTIMVQPVVHGGQTVSSTTIRALVRAGKVETARHLLGRPFSLVGSVVSGKGIGSKKTVPTLNLSPEQGVRPGRGVYVTLTCDRESGKLWTSVTNVGTNPTFGDGQLTIETHLIEAPTMRTFSRIEPMFLHRLRDERRFTSAEALRRQIFRDVELAKRYFKLCRITVTNYDNCIY